MSVFSFDGASPSIDQTAWLAPDVTLVGRVSVGRESSIWFRCVARGDINSVTIGNQTNIQDACLMHVTHKHALLVRDRVTVGHGVILHGCEIQSDCLIGMGSIILDGAVVGEGSLVGAGSVVPPNMQIPPNSLVMGVPAKIIRPLSEDDRTKMSAGWQNYIGYANSYRTQLATQLQTK